MFVGDEVLLDAGFGVARARLADLALSDALQRASEDAYRHGIAGPVGGLARVHVRELAGKERSAGLAIRWEVAGADGALFPVLDADITLIPGAGGTAVLALAGVYRPPHARASERAVLRQLTSTAIRSFLGRVAAEIVRAPRSGR
jgi:hypothetical protein